MRGRERVPHPILDHGGRRTWWRRLGTVLGRFRYAYADGRPIRSRGARARIRRLGIPPAWTRVRICPRDGGRLQALGLDEAGRVQYLYHTRFRERQDRRKFEKIERFGEYLPQLRDVTSRDLTLPGFPKSRVLALATRLINELYFRVGSPQGVRRYRTYGLTTLHKRHLRFLPDGTLEFNFDGKHHVHTRRLLVDAELAGALRQLGKLPGSTLFQYFDDEGRLHRVRARDLNAYLKAATAPEVSAKDFRTWAGTLLVAKELARLGKGSSERDSKRRITRAVRAVAAQLGNTPAVCRKSYLHPAVLRAYLNHVSLEDLIADPSLIRARQQGYAPDELALLELFQRARRRRHAPPPPSMDPLWLPLAVPSMPTFK